MTKDAKRQALKEKHPCHACGKEVSKSVKVTPEGKDYVWHFCEKCHSKENSKSSH